MTTPGAPRPVTAAQPAAVARRESWYGPPGLVGAVVGVLVWGLPYVRLDQRSSLWLWLVPPLLGLFLLVFRGVPRRFGVGLLVSCLTLPLALLLIGLGGYLR